LQAGYLSQRWPFETLKKVSDAKDVLYWWVVEPSGQVHLASSPDMWGKTITNLAVGTRELLVKDDLLPKTGEKIKVIVNPLKIEGEGTPWTFWVGLSLRSIAAAKKRMILANVEIGLLAIAVGVFLSFFLTRSITRPIKSLINGTEAVARMN
jgi:methyl-accepting chemotaxis protein